MTANNVVFIWSADLEREFQDMKKAIQEAVKLSPIDINKSLKHKKIPYKVDWKILSKGRILNPVTRKCSTPACREKGNF